MELFITVINPEGSNSTLGSNIDMKEYKNTQEEYVNDERRIYDEEGNLIAIEYEVGTMEYFE